MSSPQRIVLGAWLAMLGLATARTLSQGRGLPQPSVYLSTAVLFTMLFGAAGLVGTLAAVFAVGVDVAAVTLPYFKGSSVGPLDQLAAALGSMSGQPPSAAHGQPSGPGGRVAAAPGPGGSTPGTLIAP